MNKIETITEAYLKLGILGLISVVFVYQNLYITNKQLSILKSIENVIVNKNLSKDQYEQMLVFKYKCITRSLLRKVGEYILKNNIINRFDIIKEELYQNVNSELIKFKYSMENMIDTDTFKRSYDYLSKELSLTTGNVVSILEKLKCEHNSNDEKNALRLAMTEVDGLENKLIAFAQDL